MLRTVWATVDGRRRLYLIGESCDFVEPVKLYLDHLAILEKSPHTLENYCRHLARYFVFLERERVDWRSVSQTTWFTSFSGCEIEPGGMKAAWASARSTRS